MKESWYAALDFLYLNLIVYRQVHKGAHYLELTGQWTSPFFHFLNGFIGILYLLFLFWTYLVRDGSPVRETPLRLTCRSSLLRMPCMSKEEPKEMCAMSKRATVEWVSYHNTAMNSGYETVKTFEHGGQGALSWDILATERST